MMRYEIKALLEFKAITHWLHNFKEWKRLKSMKPRGELGMLVPGDVQKMRMVVEDVVFMEPREYCKQRRGCCLIL